MINAPKPELGEVEPSETLVRGTLPEDDRRPFLPIEVPIPFAHEPEDFPPMLSARSLMRDLALMVSSEDHLGDGDESSAVVRGLRRAGGEDA